MKLVAWILMLALLLSPLGPRVLAIGPAYAEGGGLSSSGTASNTNSAPGTFTTSAEDQRNSQNNNKQNNDQGSQQSSMMGMMAIMAGMAMMAAGAAMMPPPTTAAGVALMAAGAMMLASGMAAMSAAKEMNKNANASGVNGINLDNLGTPTISGDLPKNIPTAGTTLDPHKQSTLTGLDPSKVKDSGAGTSMSIDPAVLASGGRADALVDDFESKTGISRGDFVEGLNSGKSPTDMLANSSEMKKAGVGADKINSLVGDAASSGNLLTGSELLDKVGMSAGDIAAMAAANSSMGSDGALASGGSSGASRSPASSTPDYSFQAPTKDLGVSSAGLGASANFANGSGHLSDSVQNALDRSGITSRTLFQMVHEQYKKKMPMMFGAQERKAASHSDNPFADLVKDKVDL